MRNSNSIQTAVFGQMAAFKFCIILFLTPKLKESLKKIRQNYHLELFVEYFQDAILG